MDLYFPGLKIETWGTQLPVRWDVGHPLRIRSVSASATAALEDHHQFAVPVTIDTILITLWVATCANQKVVTAA